MDSHVMDILRVLHYRKKANDMHLRHLADMICWTCKEVVNFVIHTQSSPLMKINITQTLSVIPISDAVMQIYAYVVFPDSMKYVDGFFISFEVVPSLAISTTNCSIAPPTSLKMRIYFSLEAILAHMLQ